MSLSEIMKNAAETNWENCEVQFELSEEADAKYKAKHGNEDNINLGTGLANLMLESTVHGERKKKALTRIDKNNIVVELFSDGEPLDQTTLNMLNTAYHEGKTGKWEPKEIKDNGRTITIRERSGTKHAAKFIGKLKGEITINNCDETPYTVKNTITLKHPTSIQSYHAANHQ